MFPDVKGEQWTQAVGHGVVGAGALEDGEFAAVVCAEPHPSAAEEADALGFEFCLEGVHTAPLPLDLCGETPRGCRLRRGRELREIKVVVEYLPGIVEDGAGGCAAHNLFQCHILKSAAWQQLVEIVHIGLQVLAVVETERIGADDLFQCIGRVW